MKTKEDIFNEVIAEMTPKMNEADLESLKITLIVKFMNFNIVTIKNLPSTEVCDNEWALKRFAIDQTAKGLKKSTIKQYLIIMRKFFTDTGLTYKYTKGQDITDYLALRQYKDNISQSYKSTLQRYIGAFFDWAYRKHHIETQITLDVDKVRAPQKQKERLTDEEVERCRDIVKNDDRAAALLELMLCSGARVNEICNLKIENLDFQRKEIKIWGEKSSKWRTCFMTPQFQVKMLNYLNGRTNGPVLIGKRGRGQMQDSTIEKIVKKIASDANCHCTATVHTYRKTFASREYRRTKDILFISKRLGHSSTDITIKYYICDDIELDRAMALSA